MIDRLALSVLPHGGNDVVCFWLPLVLCCVVFVAVCVRHGWAGGDVRRGHSLLRDTIVFLCGDGVTACC